MKKLLILSLVALFANLSFAQTKYVDRVLAESEVTVTKNVLYASNYTVLLGGPPFTLEPLYMDVYAPNDGVTSRPLVIYTHTGSFLPRVGEKKSLCTLFKATNRFGPAIA